MMTIDHKTVLVEEVMSALIQKTSLQAVYVDCTVGLGGHTEALLKRTAPEAKVIGLDWDEDALLRAKERLAAFRDRVILYRGAFGRLAEITARLGLTNVTGILFDLGVSSLQLVSPERGFSCRLPGPLDMRMDRSRMTTAADLVNTASEREIADMIYTYGEERKARAIARALTRYRKQTGPVKTTEDLSRLVCRVVRKPTSRWTRLHPATKTFQALRIVVNDEMRELEEGLSQATALLGVGGRLGVISFHSLEDRIVKKHFKAAATHAEYRCINLYKKPITPTASERAKNPSARSAKLRVLERVA